MDTENKIAIYVLNRYGLPVANKILKEIRYVDVFFKDNIDGGENRSHAFSSLKSVVVENFAKYRAHVFICATGIVVRIICPLIDSKDTDPAIVVIDPVGKFVISLLSGHLGGANSLATRIAQIIDATPVITTATDSFHLPAIDNIARELDMSIDDISKIKEINSAILNHDPLVVYDPLNLLNIRSYFPDSYPLTIIDKVDKFKREDIGIICDYKDHRVHRNKIILYPKVLYVGIGCNKNTDVSEILDLIYDVFGKQNLAIQSIYAIVTTSKKRNENGIIELAKILKRKLIFIDHSNLDLIDVPNPSKNVKKHMGVYSVSEASAIIASKGKIIVEKKKSKNATVAVALKNLNL